MYRIQVRQTHPKGAWYWRIVALNGQVVLTSEVYATRSNAIRAATKFYVGHRGLGANKGIHLDIAP